MSDVLPPPPLAKPAADSNLPITLQYQFERSDYAEAEHAGRSLVWQGIAFHTLLGVFCSLIIGATLGQALRPRAAGEPPFGAGDVISCVLPWLVIGGGLLWVMLARAKPLDGSPHPSAWIRNSDRIISILICLSAAAAIFGSNYLAEPVVPPAPAPTKPVSLKPLLVVLCYLVLVMNLGFLLVHFAAMARRQGWERQPILHRLQNLSFDDTQVVSSNDLSQTRYTWQAFVSWDETANLFLLRLSHLMFVMVPKRAFASAAQMDAFRELVRGHIAPPAILTSSA
jgi:hypothetical protein